MRGPYRALALLAIALHAPPLGAEPAQCLAEGATAEDLFRQGRLEEKRQDYVAAGRCFMASYRLERAVGTLLNLAICDDEQGLLLAAREAYLEVLAALPAGDERRSIAQARFRKVDARVPRLTLRLGEYALAEVKVTQDGAVLPISALGRPQLAAVGRHVVVVSAADHDPARYEVTLREGEQKEVVVTPLTRRAAIPVLPPANGTPPRASASYPSRTLEWAGIANGGIGALALGVSGYHALEALHKKNAADGNCEGDVCGPRGLAERAEAVRLGNRATAFLIGGSVLVGAGVTLFVIGRSASKARPYQVGVSLAPHSLVGGAIDGKF